MQKAERKSLTFFLLVLSLVVSFISYGCGSSNSSNEELAPLDEALTLQYVKEAFTFTFPLVYMHITKVRFTNAMCPTPVAAPVNQLCHSEFIADTNYGETEHVNYDVVTSQAFLDLKDDGVVFVKPIPERYCVFELFDAYTNCIITIGEGIKEKGSGKTVPISNGTKYLITGPNYKGSVPTGMIRVKVPTNIAWLIGRVRCIDEADLENVKEIQNEMDLKALKLYMSGSPQPYSPYYDPNEYVPLTKLKSLTSDEYFNLANDLMVTNPPKTSDSETLKRLKRVGVGPGLKFNPAILGERGENYFESMKNGLMSYEWQSKSQPYLFTATNHDTGNWKFYTYQIADFGTEYDYRAFCALKYLCVHPNSTCITYFKYKDDDNETLNGTYTYRLRFKKGMFPPLSSERGFWSITVYDKTNHVITENENTIYSVTDLTDLAQNATYTDIILQSGSSDSSSGGSNGGGNNDEDEEATNILQTPIDEDFHLLMRIYLPNEAVINGFWNAPNLTRIKEEEEEENNKDKK